jgi:hypothetical protein
MCHFQCLPACGKSLHSKLSCVDHISRRCKKAKTASFQASLIQAVGENERRTDPIEQRKDAGESTEAWGVPSMPPDQEAPSTSVEAQSEVQIPTASLEQPLDKKRRGRPPKPAPKVKLGAAGTLGALFGWGSKGSSASSIGPHGGSLVGLVGTHIPPHCHARSGQGREVVKGLKFLQRFPRSSRHSEGGNRSFSLQGFCFTVLARRCCETPRVFSSGWSVPVSPG